MARNARLAVCLAAALLAVAATATDSGSTVVHASDPPPRLDLLDAIDIALRHNLELRATLTDLDADAARVRQARSELLPRLQADLEARRIDAPRAEAAMGRQPQYRTGGVLRLDQIIYSDQRRARLQIERTLELARAAQREELVLDVILTAATAYLGLLRAEASLRIRGEEVALNRANLEQARDRFGLGTTDRAEVFRWETALARSRSEESGARAEVEAARLELNRVLSRPLEARYRTVDPTLDDPYFLIASDEVRELIDSPARRPRLRHHHTEEAIRHAPALARLREEITARRRELLTSERNITHPTLTASATLDQEFSRHGRGTDELDIDFADIFPDLANGGRTRIGGRTDDLEWTIALRASLPLYQGGMRRARVDEERARLDALLLRHDELIERLRAEVLTRAHRTEASYDAIGFADEAARAGAANLDLVREAHARGVLPVIDLLDAQSTSLAADLQAANATFDFLLDYLRLQRATGRFDLTASAEELEARRVRLLEVTR